MGSRFPRTPHGVLLVGHGTREPAGIQEFCLTAGLISKIIDDAMSPIQWDVIPCYLEFAKPTILEGVAPLVLRQVREITVMPLLLFAAGHAKHDIPSAIAAAAASYPLLRIRQAAHLGCAPSVVVLSRQRYAEALAQRPVVSSRETLLLLIGRGSHDRDATAEMYEFARLRREQGDADRVDVGFLAMARPSLVEALAAIPREGIRRIVIQPHLLFDGLLLRELRCAVEQFARERPDQECILTERLGVSPLVADAAIERILAMQAT